MAISNKVIYIYIYIYIGASGGPWRGISKLHNSTIRIYPDKKKDQPKKAIRNYPELPNKYEIMKISFLHQHFSWSEEIVTTVTHLASSAFTVFTNASANSPLDFYFSTNVSGNWIPLAIRMSQLFIHASATLRILIADSGR